MTLGYPSSLTTAPRRLPSSAGENVSGVLRRMDWVLTLAVLALSLIGGVLVWSATRPGQLQMHADPTAWLKKHLLNIAIGLVLGAVTALFDYRALRAYAPILYGLSVLGLIAVLSPLGSTINGSHSWIELPAGFSVQPSEFAKVGLVLGMAMLLSEKRDAEDNPRDIDVVLALALAAPPALLVLLQPDLGTIMVLAVLVFGVIAVSGAPRRWLVGLLAALAIGSFLVIRLHLLKQYQVNRFLAFVDPNRDPQGAGFNVRQAKIAVGSGGLTGQGLFHGQQTQGRFVPENHTDFVFTVAGEELGLLGGLVIIALLVLVMWRGLRIAAQAEDMFGRLVAVGIVCWFAFQAFENIGMCIGIMPVTGLPLPFVSYGGSSMFANMMAVGLLQNVHMRRYA